MPRIGCSILGYRHRSFRQFAREWAVCPDIFWPYHPPQLQPNGPVFALVGALRSGLWTTVGRSGWSFIFFSSGATSAGSSDNSLSIKSSHSIFFPTDRNIYTILRLSLIYSTKKATSTNVCTTSTKIVTVPSPIVLSNELIAVLSYVKHQLSSAKLC